MHRCGSNVYLSSFLCVLGLNKCLKGEGWALSRETGYAVFFDKYGHHVMLMRGYWGTRLMVFIKSLAHPSYAGDIAKISDCLVFNIHLFVEKKTSAERTTQGCFLTIF